MMRSGVALLIGSLSVVPVCAGQRPTPTGVTMPPSAVRDRFDLDTALYGKYADADGIPVLAAAKVPGEALLVARDIITHMLAARADVRADIIARGGRVAVIANTDSLITGLFEARGPLRVVSNLLPRAIQRALGAPPATRYYVGRRVFGVGGAFTICAEENVLGYPGTANFGENVLVHEFAFNILASLRRVDRDLSRELEAAYRDAMARKMYDNGRAEPHYAAYSIEGYWAEGTVWWYWTNHSYSFVADGSVQTVWSPDDLQRYDPRLYAILARVYADHRIPADVYYGKKW
jgi:hypothetical protein